MYGLVVIFIVALYFLLAALCMWGMKKVADKCKWPKRRRWLCLSIVVFVFYLIPFWDYIPTLVVHKYYCDSEAGVRIYKTAKEWSKENPNVLDSLAPYEKYISYDSVYGSGSLLNERIAIASIVEKNIFLSIRRNELRVFDVETEEVLAKRVRFGRGYGNISLGGKEAWKFWLHSNHCFSRDESIRNADKMKSIYKSFNAKGD